MDNVAQESYFGNITKSVRARVADAAHNLANASRRLLDLGELEERAASEEIRRSEAFVQKLLGRLESRYRALTLDPNTKLKTPGSQDRSGAMDEWLETLREARILANMHTEAVQRRYSVAARIQEVRDQSPRGARWHLDYSKRTHTPDCVAMAGRNWSWKVLDVINPYNRHAGCGCYLTPLGAGDSVRDTPPVQEARFIRNTGKVVFPSGTKAVSPATYRFQTKLTRQRRSNMAKYHLGGGNLAPAPTPVNPYDERFEPIYATVGNREIRIETEGPEAFGWARRGYLFDGKPELPAEVPQDITPYELSRLGIEDAQNDSWRGKEILQSGSWKLIKKLPKPNEPIIGKSFKDEILAYGTFDSSVESRIISKTHGLWSRSLGAGEDFHSADLNSSVEQHLLFYEAVDAAIRQARRVLTTSNSNGEGRE